MTAENVAEFVADPVVRERAKKLLARLGFRVGRASAFSLGVEAPAERFEQVFGAHVCVGEDDEAGYGHQDESHEVHWAGKPKMPALLEDLVDDVVFPRSVSQDRRAAAAVDV